MLTRALGSAALALTLAVGPLAAQGAATGKEPESHGRKLSEWIADLKAPAPQRRRLRDLRDGPGRRRGRSRPDRKPR